MTDISQPPWSHLAADPMLLESLASFNQEVLAQGKVLVESCCNNPAGPTYLAPIGPHMRHVIEHYEALLMPAKVGVVDYDQRPRDPVLETDPFTALRRIGSLIERIQSLGKLPAATELEVRGLAGVAGDYGFVVRSTMERELVFVATHAIHHYAMVSSYCVQHGVPISPEFGRAPATVAHDRQTPVLTHPKHHF